MTNEAALDSLPSVRLLKANLRIDGVKFSLKRYPYIRELLDGPDGCRVRESTTIKGGQMGFTIAEILRTLDDAKHLKLRGILYLFPTDKDVIDFSKARFGPIQDNEAFAGLSQSTDSAGLKRFGDTHVYFRGAGSTGTSAKRSKSALKSIPVDIVKLDEEDEMQRSRIDVALQRLGGSMCPEVSRLSTPTLPNYGVDLEYKNSDQRVWMYKCNGCRDWTCLELNWPDCLVRKERDSFYKCEHCGTQIDRANTFAQWVAMYPDRLGECHETSSGWTYEGHAGHWISQLCSPTRTPYDVLEQEEKANRSGRLSEFYNQVLARPYADLEDMLDEATINECVTDQPRTARDPGPCAMGVDPGIKKTWYWVKRRESETVSRTLAYGHVATFSELHDIAQNFGVTCGVIDGMAETHAVRKFVEEHSNWWMCQYGNHKTKDSTWDAKTRVLTANRTEALDASHAKIVNKLERLPAANEYHNDYVLKHLCNMARIRHEDDKTGDERMEWIIVGGTKNDHLKHAHSYATLAESQISVASAVQRARNKFKRRKNKRRSFMGS